jgi:hypothetical protein
LRRLFSRLKAITRIPRRPFRSRAAKSYTNSTPQPPVRRARGACFLVGLCLPGWLAAHGATPWGRPYRGGHGLGGHAYVYANEFACSYAKRVETRYQEDPHKRPVGPFAGGGRGRLGYGVGEEGGHTLGRPRGVAPTVGSPLPWGRPYRGVVSISLQVGSVCGRGGVPRRSTTRTSDSSRGPSRKRWKRRTQSQTTAPHRKRKSKQPTRTSERAWSTIYLKPSRVAHQPSLSNWSSTYLSEWAMEVRGKMLDKPLAEAATAASSPPPATVAPRKINRLLPRLSSAPPCGRISRPQRWSQRALLREESD